MTSAVSALHIPYDPNNSRELLESRAHEVENAFGFPIKKSSVWMRQAEKKGFKFSHNIAHSLYADTHHMDLFANGWTGRIRRKADSNIIDIRNRTRSVKENFPDQIAFKSRCPEFQVPVWKLIQERYPAYESAGVYPYIRNEIEGPHHYLHDASELRFGDLPSKIWKGHDRSIAEIVKELVLAGKISNIDNPDDLVLKPFVTTTVKRNRTNAYIDPDEEINFIDKWPSPAPTKRMIETGVFLCLEIAIDECVNRMPLPGATISEIVEASGNAFSKFRNLGQIGLFEDEFKYGHHGPHISDAQALDSKARFDIALSEFAQNRLDFELKPTRSKAVNAFGNLEDCQPGGSLHGVYSAALAIAP